jgi:hypothetical protein
MGILRQCRRWSAYTTTSRAPARASISPHRHPSRSFRHRRHSRNRSLRHVRACAKWIVGRSTDSWCACELAKESIFGKLAAAQNNWSSHQETVYWNIVARPWNILILNSQSENPSLSDQCYQCSCRASASRVLDVSLLGESVSTDTAVSTVNSDNECCFSAPDNASRGEPLFCPRQNHFLSELVEPCELRLSNVPSAVSLKIFLSRGLNVGRTPATT